jgi:hypothetical protein
MVKTEEKKNKEFTTKIFDFLSSFMSKKYIYIFITFNLCFVLSLFFIYVQNEINIFKKKPKVLYFLPKSNKV